MSEEQNESLGDTQEAVFGDGGSPGEAAEDTGSFATDSPAEVPAAVEPATEEPATEEPATEEPATEEPATEEPATEEPGEPETAASELPAEAPAETPVETTPEPAAEPAAEDTTRLSDLEESTPVDEYVSKDGYQLISKSSERLIEAKNLATAGMLLTVTDAYGRRETFIPGVEVGKSGEIQRLRV